MKIITATECILGKNTNFECEIINLKREYGNEYNGKEKYAFITDLPENQIIELYPEEANKYSPYLLLPKAYKDIRNCYIKNELKYRSRHYRYCDVFGYIDGISECFHSEIISETLENIVFLKFKAQKSIHSIEMLPEPQKRRLKKFLFLNKKIIEIASEECVTKAAISASLKLAFRKISKQIDD